MCYTFLTQVPVDRCQVPKRQQPSVAMVSSWSLEPHVTGTWRHQITTWWSSFIRTIPMKNSSLDLLHITKPGVRHHNNNKHQKPRADTIQCNVMKSNLNCANLLALIRKTMNVLKQSTKWKNQTLFGGYQRAYYYKTAHTK